MKYIFVIIIGVFLVAGFLTIYFRGNQRSAPQNSSSQIQNSNIKAEKINGWVHTEGIKLLDQDNKEVRLTGLTANGMEIGSGYPGVEEKQHTGCNGWQAPTQVEYDNFANWGFNSARVPLSWANLEPTPPTKNADGSFTHTWNQRYLQDVDNIVNEFGKRGIPIIIGLHQFDWSPAFKNITQPLGHFCEGQGMPVWTLPNAQNEKPKDALCNFFEDKTENDVPIDVQQGFIEAWKFLADRYKDKSTVFGFDLFNEPYPGKNSSCSAKDLNLDSFYLKLGSAVREVNSKAILFYEDSTLAGEQDGFSLTKPIPFANSVYTFHQYTANWTPTGIKTTEAYLDRAKKWNVPLWVGEWGPFDTSNKPDITDKGASQTSQMLEFWKQNNIGWAFWAYFGEYGLMDRNVSLRSRLLQVLQLGF